MTRVDRYPPHDVEGKESISRMYISLSRFDVPLFSKRNPCYFQFVKCEYKSTPLSTIPRKESIEAELSSSIQGFVHSEERS